MPEDVLSPAPVPPWIPSSRQLVLQVNIGMVRPALYRRRQQPAQPEHGGTERQTLALPLVPAAMDNTGTRPSRLASLQLKITSSATGALTT